MKEQEPKSDSADNVTKNDADSSILDTISSSSTDSLFSQEFLEEEEKVLTKEDVQAGLKFGIVGIIVGGILGLLGNNLSTVFLHSSGYGGGYIPGAIYGAVIGFLVGAYNKDTGFFWGAIIGMLGSYFICGHDLKNANGIPGKGPYYFSLDDKWSILYVALPGALVFAISSTLINNIGRRIFPQKVPNLNKAEMENAR